MSEANDDDFDDEYDLNSSSPGSTANSTTSDSKKHARAQHNALERRRRDNIKDMYISLSKELPNFSPEKASRAQILKKTIETIQQTNSETIKLKADIERLEAMNTEMRKQLENQAPEKSDEQPQSNGQTSAANR